MPDDPQAALPSVATSARLCGIDSLTEAAKTRQTMLPSPSEANVPHNDDFELARSAKRELMYLRSRGTTSTADDVINARFVPRVTIGGLDEVGGASVMDKKAERIVGLGERWVDQTFVGDATRIVCGFLANEETSFAPTESKRTSAHNNFAIRFVLKNKLDGIPRREMGSIDRIAECRIKSVSKYMNVCWPNGCGVQVGSAACSIPMKPPVMKAGGRELLGAGLFTRPGPVRRSHGPK